MSTIVAMPLRQVKCQCCLKTFDESDKVFILTEKVKTQFKVFTQLEIDKQNQICVLCKRTLTYVHCWIKSLKENRDNRVNSIVATKCTCCLRNFNDTIKKTALTVKVKSQLVDLIQSKISKKVKTICTLCKKELSYFAKLRQEFIQKQINLVIVEEIKKKVIKKEPEWRENSRFEDYQDVETSRTLFQCEICGFELNSLLEKVIHKLNCEELIEQEKNQYQNSKKESPLGTKFELHQCTLCKIDYDCIQKFIMHLKHKHSFVRNFKCEMCGKAFKTRGQLKDHITRRHNDVRKHSCLQCHREYIYESHLKIHIRRYHNKERSYICKHCEKGFFDLFELKQHRKTHVGINYVI